MTEIRYVDQTLRDGQQSYSGMRMQAGHMLAVAPEVPPATMRSTSRQLSLRGARPLPARRPVGGADAIRAALPGATLRAGMRANGVVGMGVAPTR